MNINKIIREKNLVIPLLGAPGTTLSKTTLKENLTDSQVQYKTLSMLIDKFNPDGIFPMTDLTVEIEALGLEINFPENAHPSVATHPVKNREDLEILKGHYKKINDPKERLRTALESLQLGVNKSELCRREGIYLQQLLRWTNEALKGAEESLKKALPKSQEARY